MAAGSWGAGDFAGGMAVKSAGAGLVSSLRVIVAAHAASLSVLLAVNLVEMAMHGTLSTALPHGAPVWWALLGGVTAGLSIAAFYMALARGAMGASAAVSGLLAAAIPAAVSSALEGRPRALQTAGFLLAGLAIWAIAASPGSDAPSESADKPESQPRYTPRAVMGLAILGGLGFGLYFVSLRLANPLGVLAPITLARCGSLVTCSLLLMVLRFGRAPGPGAPAYLEIKKRSGGLSRTALAWTLGVAVLDTGGNLLFIASTRVGRLDVASVLAALYPAATILLAAWQLHERPSTRQLAGMGLALAAVVLVMV